MPNLQQRLATALSGVRNERHGTDVLSAEQVRDIAVTRDGRVRLTLVLSAADDAVLVREVRQAVEQVEGVAGVTIDVKDPAELERRPPAHPAAEQHSPRPEPRSLPVIGQEPQSRRAAVPAQTPVAYPDLGRIIAVSSGKGGVGKSTVAVNLAVSLALEGRRVGLMDADIYGPDIPRMMGLDEQPRVEGNRIIPLEAHGVKLMSLGFLVERDQPAIWRGPIIMKIITQFLKDVDWGQLDYFIVDLPPGTGDAQLSLVQATQVHGVVIVTTPQDVATGDALRGAKMFERTGIRVLGVAENMSWFECAHCGAPSALFGSGGGQRLANELGVPLLGQIPLDQRVYEGGDAGAPIVTAAPDSPPAVALRDLAGRVRGLADSGDPPVQ
ncbi:MAG TPA: Mrp/NBP35 family ATP-binding protein [Gemmatimonadaceae bacterium]|nr:Mrp/NBP35 family ATP-binding protein [Gemmatimonadaceae bacterium]